MAELKSAVPVNALLEICKVANTVEVSSVRGRTPVRAFESSESDFSLGTSPKRSGKSSEIAFEEIFLKERF